MLFSSLEELRRMSRMVDDMLFLAKSDNHMIVPNLEEANLAEVTASVLDRSEEHTSELQSLMRISYAVFCLKKKNKSKTYRHQKPTVVHNSTTPKSWIQQTT